MVAKQRGILFLLPASGVVHFNIWRVVGKAGGDI
jgi:hypothetical protein